MTAAEIIERVAADGVVLALSGDGAIAATGDKNCIDRWLPVIREHKTAIVNALSCSAWHAIDDTVPTPADDRLEQEADKLRSNPGLIYAMTAYDDIEPEAVILALAIRGKGACELRIPKSRYDAFALLELIEKHTTQETLQ